MVQEGDIICVVCGTNLLTGQKISADVKSRDRTSRNTGLYAALGIAAAVLLVALGLWLYVNSRDEYKQAMRMVERQEFLEAQDLLQKYVEKAPNDERALIELGRLQWRNNLYAQAAGTFEQVVNINPSNTRAALWAVSCLDSAGGAGARPRQIALLEKVVAAEPDNAESWYMLALARGTQNDSAGQVEALERVLALGEFEAQANQAMAVALALRGQYDQAKGQLSAAGEEVKTGDLIALQGFVSAMHGQEDDAAAKLEQATASTDLTVRWEALTQLGKILLEKGEFAAAEARLQEAVNLRQDNDAARYLHAVALKAQEHYADALIEFDTLSRERDEYAHDAAVQAADIHIRQNNVERARQSLDAAASIGQPGASYHTVRGKMFVKAGDAVGAEDSFRRAINADPGYAPAYLESGLLRVRSEDLAQGLQQLETYLELLGPDAQGPQINEIRELAKQLRQTTSETVST